MIAKNITFSNNKQPEFITELRSAVKQYFEHHNLKKTGNYKLAIKALFMMVLYLAPYTLMVSGLFSSVFLIFGCFLLMGIGKAGVGMGIMHDANHKSASGKPWINSLFGKTLYLLGGSPVTWGHQHNTLHHSYTNIEGHDEDINAIGLIRLSPHKKRKKIHRFQHLYAWFFYTLMTISWITTKDFKQLTRYYKSGVKLSSMRSINRLMVELIISKVIYYMLFLVIPIILLPIPWYLTVLFFLGMHMVSGLILTTIFQTAHVMPSSDYPLPGDDGNIENNWAIHQLQTTANFAPKNRVLNWYIGGLNYQIEHHLFPNISHIHYPKIAHIVKKTAQKYSLPYHVEKTFLSAVREHYKMLKRLGTHNTQ